MTIVLSCGCIHEPNGQDPRFDYDVFVQGECRQIADTMNALGTDDAVQAWLKNSEKHHREIDEYRKRSSKAKGSSNG